MRLAGIRLGIVAVFLLSVTGVPLARAAPGPTFTVTIKSAFLRSQPSFNAARAYSVFRDQTYNILSRTSDGNWLQLDFAGATDGTWVFIAYGLVSGDLERVPAVPAIDVIGPPAAVNPLAPGSASASNALVRFTIKVRSAYARGAPSFDAARVHSVFQGENYVALARSADSLWLRLDVTGAAAVWAPVSFGSVQGEVTALPVGGVAASVVSATPPPPSPVLPTVSERARGIYQAGLALGNDPRSFSKVGDCQSVAPFFLIPFDKGEYRLGSTYAYLQETITNFSGDFGRFSQSAQDGLNVKSIFDPIWSSPKLCQKSENPLACEYRLNRPSIAIISLGTNGTWQTSEEYEGYLRQILDSSIAQGVLPVLSTKADNLEGGDRFNQVVIKLAGEYQVPLWNFALAARALPNGGLADAYHLAWGQAFFDRPGALLLGWQVRNLTALQALDVVWRGVR